MSGQTTVELRIENATPGLISDIHSNNEIVSRAAQVTPPAQIVFGLVVGRGTNPDDQAIPGGSPTNFLGVTVRSVGKEGIQNALVLAYSNTEAMAIMREGRIFATCPTGCVPGDVVNFVNATGVLDSGAAIADETNIVGASWESTTAAGKVGLLRLKRDSALTAGS